MKRVKLLVFLTQLGASVAIPMGGFVGLAVWLRQRFEWGVWVIIAGVAVGFFCAVSGFRSTLKTMERLAKDQKTDTPPPICFQDHE